jgi:hypothetical protein
VRYRVGHLIERVLIYIGEGVAGLVIARIGRVASGAAPLVLLLLCLNVLSPGKQPTGRNPAASNASYSERPSNEVGSVWCPIEAKKSTKTSSTYAGAGRAGGGVSDAWPSYTDQRIRLR